MQLAASVSRWNQLDPVNLSKLDPRINWLRSLPAARRIRSSSPTLHQSLLLSFFIHHPSLTVTLNQLTTHTSSTNRNSFLNLYQHIHPKCPQRPQLRLPPLVARPQLARLPLRRRRLARRPPRHQARRRSAPRPARRPTLHTSTKVSFHRNPAVSDPKGHITDASFLLQFSSRSTLTLVSPTVPCPS
jgi:hypothetical protein